MSIISNMSNQHEINKKILKKYIKPRPASDVLGPYNKYRDEYLEMYNEKKKRFLQLTKQYNDYNKHLLLSCKDTDYNLTDNFHKEMQIENSNDDETFNNAEAVLIRKRFEQPINSKLNYETELGCTLEPWFKRFITLSKFIYVARNVIIKNRLLKNLAILKQLNAENVQLYEKERKYHNISYSELFERFI